MKAILISFAAVLISGCASVPPAPSEVREAPKERIRAYQEKTDKTNATIVVTRDTGMIGSGCYLAVSIDGKLAARLNPSEMAKFYVEPGEILLKSSLDPEGKGLCGAHLNDFTQRETILRSNETKAFRLSIDTNGKTDISRSEK